MITHLVRTVTTAKAVRTVGATIAKCVSIVPSLKKRLVLIVMPAQQMRAVKLAAAALTAAGCAVTNAPIIALHVIGTMAKPAKIAKPAF